MKTVKRYMTLFVAVLFTLSLMVNASAQGTIDANSSIGEEIELQYIVSCPSGVKHPMLSVGRAFLYDKNGNKFNITMNAYQCSECYLMLLTESNPVIYPNNPWGMYYTESRNELVLSGLGTHSIGTNLTSLSELPVITSVSNLYAQGFDFGAVIGASV